MVAVSGSRDAVASVVQALGPREVLGPVPEGEGERVYVRVPRAEGAVLAGELRSVLATRSAHKEETVRVQVDPTTLG
jgi:primosomal protein N' (replication factor Y)